MKNRIENENAPRILMRGAKQKVWQRFMNGNQAALFSTPTSLQVAQTGRNSIGMNRGLRKLNVIANKQELEQG